MPETAKKQNASPLTGAGYGLPRLVTGHEPGLKSFFSNFRDFLTERPVKLKDTGAHGAFTDLGFGSGLVENLKEWFRATPRSARHVRNSDMLVDWKPWYRTFWANLRDLVAPPKLPPLRVTSKPVAVKDIWSRNEQFRKMQGISLAAHALVAILLVVPLIPRLMAPSTTQASGIQVTPIDISPYLMKLPAGTKKAGGGGGGGEHNPIPATKGRLPKFSWTRFTPPLARTPENPKLAMMPTVLGPPDLRLPSPNMPNWGDPMSKVINDSGGPGSGGGIGSGSGGGVGSGEGGGVGPGFGWGTGGGYPSAGANGYGIPACLYCPQPEYSDEAVKAKYQGVATVQVVVATDGSVKAARVLRGLGLGLDEKVLEKVRTWRLKPATGPDGKPTTVVAVVEVTFRLL
jgi:protein TonB